MSVPSATSTQRRSLRQKLVTMSTTILVGITLGMLLVVSLVQYRGQSRQLQETETRIRDAMQSKGETIVENQALALRGMVEDNSFTDIQSLVERTVKKDDEILYGVFCDMDISPDAITYQEPGDSALFTTEKVVETLRLSEELMEQELNDNQNKRFISVGGKEVMEFSRHIIYDDEDVGSIRYGISTVPMRTALANLQERSSAEIQQTIGLLLAISLLAMAAGFAVTRRQAGLIAHPLSLLTDATSQIAKGDRNITVSVSSGDELETLATSFNAMVHDLGESDRKIAQAHHELEVLNQGLEDKVRERTRELKTKTDDINIMLQNLQQGIFTILPDLTIHHEYSAHLEVMFETHNIAGRGLKEFLFDQSETGADIQHQVETCLYNCIEEHYFNLELNSHLLVTSIVRQRPSGSKIHLEVDWNEIIEDETVTKMMVTLRDVTELLELQAQAEVQRRQLMIIGQILAISPGQLAIFRESSAKYLNRNHQLLEQSARPEPTIIRELFRNIHTIKGNARTYKLSTITDSLHLAEGTLQNIVENPESEWEFERIKSELAECQRDFDEVFKIFDSELAGRFSDSDSGTDKYNDLATSLSALTTQYRHQQIDDKTYHTAIDELAYTATSIPFRDLLSESIKNLSETAVELGKVKPKFVLTNPSVRIPDPLVSVVQDVFNHLLRNSIDHGLEPAHERIDAGKDPEGTIVVDASPEDGKIVFAVTDDGRGLNLRRLRELTEDASTHSNERSDLDVAQSIFKSGLSTAETVTEISGRGVGMDAIRAYLEERNGGAHIELLGGQAGSDYRPCKVVFELPVSRS